MTRTQSATHAQTSGRCLCLSTPEQETTRRDGVVQRGGAANTPRTTWRHTHGEMNDVVREQPSAHPTEATKQPSNTKTENKRQQQHGMMMMIQHVRFAGALFVFSAHCCPYYRMRNAPLTHGTKTTTHNPYYPEHTHKPWQSVLSPCWPSSH